MYFEACSLFSMALLLSQGFVQTIIYTHLGIGPFVTLLFYPMQVALLLRNNEYFGQLGEWICVFLEGTSFTILLCYIQEQRWKSQKRPAIADQIASLFILIFFVALLLISTRTLNILMIGMILAVLQKDIVKTDYTVLTILLQKGIDIVEDTLSLKPHLQVCSTLILLAGISFDWVLHIQMKKQDIRSENERVSRIQQELEHAREDKILIEQQRLKVSRLTDAHLSFLANLSHEVRTSMNGVSGIIALLSDSNLDDEAKEYVFTLEKSVDSLMGLINDSLNFSRLDAQDANDHEMVPFNLDSLLEDALDLANPRIGDKDVDISYYIEDDVPTNLIGDATALRTILFNLVSNSIKFTQQGSVSIDISCLQKNEAIHKVQLQMEVSDSGIGIPEEYFDSIFKPFSKLSTKTIPKYGGSGLGLAMCDKVVRVLNGSISFTSTVGVGTTFKIQLPLKYDGQNPFSPPHPPEETLSASILIIDNSENILKYLKKRLQMYGCQVEIATNWVDGIKALKKAAVLLGRPYDLLLMDYSMPGLNGNEVVKLIRKDETISSISIVMMPTLKQKPLVTASVQGFLIKPLRENHIWSIVSTLCKDTKKKDGIERVPTTSGKPTEKVQLHVLMAEDNVMNQRILRSMVERLGHVCHVASNGREAVEEFHKKNYLDVIFMDCRMPVLDGFEATKLIREEESLHPAKNNGVRHIPIIALTADIMHGTREACLQVGMDDYLHKPVKMSAIQEILQALVEKKSNLAMQEAEMIKEVPITNSSDEFVSEKKPAVLLVEDNEVNIKIGSMILKKHGFDFHVARDGQSAVEMVKANPNLYQIILMDMHMPGMDGQTATAQIRAFEEENNLPRKPIIALTGDTTEGFRGICLAAGCSEYMPKPVDYPLLVQLCKKFVNDYQRSK